MYLKGCFVLRTDEGLETNLASLPPVSQLSCESRDANDDDSQQVLADMTAAPCDDAASAAHDIAEAFSRIPLVVLCG